MELSDTGILIGLSLTALVVGALIFYIVRGSRRNRIERQTKPPYRWKPEQDYDVVYSDEGPMSPPFPSLKKRRKRPPKGKV